ncbi:hypothetical protein AABB24_031201 [Solanum stoloniferum]|uniref:GOLD domain-containing protein n=1 Tax=Solanum stoloniferum TaxID=62892 RepID=A0ABD2RSL3_9SOLN
MKLMEVLNVVVVVAMVMMMAAEAIWLELPNSETKCVYEDIRNNVVVLGEYIVIHADEEHAQANFIPTISVQVTSPFGNSLHHEENATYGRFAFTTSEHGNYLACFWMNSHVPGNKSAAISLQWKIGIDARDWDSIARKEKIEGVELELMKLKGLAQAVHENLLYLKKREEEMRGVSERTNGAVAWFSMMSLSICVMAAAVQIWYLKSYFRKKRLI